MAALVMGRNALLAVAAGVGAEAIRRQLSRRRRLASDRQVVAATAAVLRALAAELKVGRPLAIALAATATDAPARMAAPLVEAARVARLGSDPAEALLACPDLVVAAALRPLAAALRVVSTGAGLATVTERLATASRADQRIRDAVRTELAAPTATAVLLAGLPLIGLLLAAGFGAHPAHVLLHTSSGAACLAMGTILDLLGLAWSRRIVRGAAP